MAAFSVAVTTLSAFTTQLINYRFKDTRTTIWTTIGSFACRRIWETTLGQLKICLYKKANTSLARRSKTKTKRFLKSSIL